MNEKQEGQGAEPPREISKSNWGALFVEKIKCKYKQHCAEKSQENAQDRAARRTAIATIWIAIFTAVTFGVACSTYYVLRGQLDVMRSTLIEMQAAGVTNKSVAEATKQQAEAAARQADAAANQAIAASQSAKTARDSLISAQRAVIGPTNASIVGALETNNSIKATINYANTGRQAAPSNSGLVFKIFSITEWNNGIAAHDITDFQQTCMKSELQAPSLVVYPIFGLTGGQTINLDSGSKNIPEQQRVMASDNLVAGSEIFALKICFVYRTIEITHHSASCFFYQANIVPASSLGFCTAGQSAD